MHIGSARVITIGSVGLLATAVGAATYIDWPLWWAPVGFGLVGASLVNSGAACGHDYPALLPSERRRDGTMEAAKWHCCDCGETWPAEEATSAGPSARRLLA